MLRIYTSGRLMQGPLSTKKSVSWHSGLSADLCVEGVFLGTAFDRFVQLIRSGIGHRTPPSGNPTTQSHGRTQPGMIRIPNNPRILPLPLRSLH